MSLRVTAMSCRSVQGVSNKHPLGKRVSNKHPLETVSGAFLNNPCACHFVSILTSFLEILAHFTSDAKKTHAFLLAKIEIGRTTDATRVGLEDFGLELIIFWCAISMNAYKGCPLGTP